MRYTLFYDDLKQFNFFYIFTEYPQFGRKAYPCCEAYYSFYRN